MTGPAPIPADLAALLGWEYTVDRNWDGAILRHIITSPYVEPNRD